MEGQVDNVLWDTVQYTCMLYNVHLNEYWKSSGFSLQTEKSSNLQRTHTLYCRTSKEYYVSMLFQI